MSRLLTTLLLYRNGFYVRKYISLEAKIAKSKDLYYDALGQAQIGWHEGTEDVVPFIKYLLGTILAAYKDFEDRFALVETKLPAMEAVRRATMNKISRFTKQDIRELCPSLSIPPAQVFLLRVPSVHDHCLLCFLIGGHYETQLFAGLARAGAVSTLVPESRYAQI